MRAFGLKWLVLMVLVPVPWSTRIWALPVLTVLVHPPRPKGTPGIRPKTVVNWTCQLIRLVRRWVPTRSLVLVGDGT